MTPVLKTVLLRLGLGVVTLFLVTLLVFFAVNLMPGDFATEILGQEAAPETVAAFQRELGLDRPAMQRYVHWIGGAMQGDLGTSFAGAGSGTTRTVTSLVGPRLVNTLFLATATAVIAVPLSLLLGIFAALYRNSLYDRFVNLVSLTTVSVPEFFIAYILLLLLAIKFPIFYALANVSPDMPLAERLTRCALPILTLVLAIVAHMMRMTRAAIINLLASPYVQTARLKGVGPRRLIFHHVLPNAWAPIATVVALTLAYLVVGVVVVEVVFNYPGIGRLIVDSVTSRDIPVVQACALIFAVIYISLNLLADTVSIVTNPRLLHPR
ncbi:ABC transporter permease [Bradyrhizobium valentinum]|uniref:ABC transporter permease n=1 Tax=Bradyrhizobium valentinum TaxID=1518501 RepID=UPI00070DDB8B|nr:ABC transporter permease [Bradyrhizobium valentinum]KRQ96834.1 ABC transporter permease [Bradyrhizobium valentinum]